MWLLVARRTARANSSLRTTAMQLFGETKRWMELTPPPSVWVHVAELTALGAAAFAGLVWRVRRVSV